MNIQVIIGSTRPNRFSEKPAHWIMGELAKHEGVQAELIDLRDYPLPMFDAEISPAWSGGQYPHESVMAWAAKISQADAYIMIAPEYNHGYSAVLKNALDWLYPEWAHKPVGFISYGGNGGARAVEQLRQVVVELQMLPVKYGIHIPVEAYIATMNLQAPVDPELFNGPLNARFNLVDTFINELTELAAAVQTLRTPATVNG